MESKLRIIIGLEIEFFAEEENLKKRGRGDVKRRSRETVRASTPTSQFWPLRFYFRMQLSLFFPPSSTRHYAHVSLTSYSY
jgi:hypothetical protein